MLKVDPSPPPMASCLILRPRSLSKLSSLLSLHPYFHASQIPQSRPKLGLRFELRPPQSHPQFQKPHFFCTSSPIEPQPIDFNPKLIYSDLAKLDLESHTILPKREWESLAAILRSFTNSPWTSDQSLAIYVPSSFFPTAAKSFRHFFLHRCSLPLFHHLAALQNPNEFLLPVFFDYCLDTFCEELKQFKTLMQTADLTRPHTWFPFARAMKRKIVYHCGPTNSGKTYNALQRFMEAKNGVYCGPLRLLAMEVFDKVNSLGVYCSLLTGQEKKTFPFSNHVACTIEMVSTEELYEVAVIDEVQMMADPTRGYAWTRALLGLKADEIHLCGDPSVLKIVKRICRETGDELEVNSYKRFMPLVVEAKTLLGDLRNVMKGDCIVAFSRREIFEVKLAIEKFTKFKCCVIYGALPPETRRQQASLFNDQGNEYEVLVASDAVGMGLNLNIKRVVFYSLAKYNGDKMMPVPASQVKQIAGRAGRRGSSYPEGLVTTFLLDDLDYLIQCLHEPFEEVRKVGLFPFFEQVELFAAQFPYATFCELLDKFRDNCRLDGSYFLCQHENIRKVANMLEKVKGLTLEERFNFCFAPVNIRDPKAMFHLLKFASQYSEKRPVGIAMGMPKGSARNDAELLVLESKHQVLSMYLWLSYHFQEDTFPYVEKAENMAVSIADLLNKSLAKACWKPSSTSRGGGPQSHDEEHAMQYGLKEGDLAEFKPVRNAGRKPVYERPRSLIKAFTMKRGDRSQRNFIA